MFEKAKRWVTLAGGAYVVVALLWPWATDVVTSVLGRVGVNFDSGASSVLRYTVLGILVSVAFELGQKVASTLFAESDS